MKTKNDTDTKTMEFYAREAPVYTASGPGGVSQHLHGFLKRVKPGGKILELGCGGGRDSQEMLRLGFDVTPTDGVLEIAKIAEQRLGIPVRILRFDQLDFSYEFDAVYANASLLHVPLHSLSDILARVHQALKPGGYHFASFKSGGTSGRDKFQRYFNYVSPQQVNTAYAQSAAWKMLRIEEYTGGGYEGGKGPWVAITAQKSNQAK